jgi:hypothetical protein
MCGKNAAVYQRRKKLFSAHRSQKNFFSAHETKLDFFNLRRIFHTARASNSSVDSLWMMFRASLKTLRLGLQPGLFLRNCSHVAKALSSCRDFTIDLIERGLVNGIVCGRDGCFDLITAGYL